MVPGTTSEILSGRARVIIKTPDITPIELGDLFLMLALKRQYSRISSKPQRDVGPALSETNSYWRAAQHEGKRGVDRLAIVGDSCRRAMPSYLNVDQLYGGKF